MSTQPDPSFLPPQQPQPPLPPAAHPVGTDAARIDIHEKKAWSLSGFLFLLVVIVALIAAGTQASENPGLITIVAIISVILLSGLTLVNPGDAKVVQFFGSYLGTVRTPGLRFTTPFTTKRRVSVKVHNLETNELKVNDADGNPINIAAIIVWQVADTAKSVFAVENYENFVAIQAEAALRHVASTHPYDHADNGVETLRGSTAVVANELAEEVAQRIHLAGVEIMEARISSLAYAPEIAQAMLQVQQASAVLAAREKIVLGAVSMVESALTKLDEEDIVTLDDERKAAMVSNLLVVLCSDSHATPVVNAGTLYQ